MRIAKDIFEETLDGWLVPIDEPESVTIPMEDLCLVINEARKEAIEECTKVPLLKFGDKRVVAIKQSILSLINELQ